jgi:hypothetical protein
LGSAHRHEGEAGEQGEATTMSRELKKLKSEHGVFSDLWF